MQQLAGTFMPDSIKKAAKNVTVNIKDVKEEGDKATVTYTTSAIPTEQSLHLVKEKGKWLVQWTKQDQMNGAGGADSTATEPEPAMGDSTVAPEPAAAPAPADTGASGSGK